MTSMVRPPSTCTIASHTLLLQVICERLPDHHQNTCGEHQVDERVAQSRVRHPYIE